MAKNDVALRGNDVSICFNLSKEKVDNFKESVDYLRNN